jgi:carbon monoxide dehydrogenase subunit G
MLLKGSFTIKARRQAVWEFMVDPMAVGGCAPGVGGIEIVVPNQKFQAKVAAGFGGTLATFKTEVEFLELTPPTSAKFRAHGVAPNGAVDATSDMTLVERGENETEVQWTADVVVVGVLASLASRLMEVITRRLTYEFFACMQNKLNSEASKTPATPESKLSTPES